MKRRVEKFMKKKLKRFDKNKWTLIALVISMVVIGLILVIVKASGNDASIEPEEGHLAGSAVLCQNPAASGGQCVQFGSANTISRVPASIDATGVNDVTIPLNNYLASVPNNTTILFPDNGQYRIEGTLHLNDKTNVTVDGNNSKFFATTNGLLPEPPKPCTGGVTQCNPNRTRAQWAIDMYSKVLIKDMNVEGSSPNPGVNGDYTVSYEAQHGFDVNSGNGLVIDHVHVRNTWGDTVYIGGGSGPTASNVTVRNSDLTNASRSCMPITRATNVLVEYNKIGLELGCRRSMFDLEPNTSSDVISNLTIRHNDIGRSRFATLNSVGQPGTVDNIVFDGNVMHGKFTVNITGFAQKHRTNIQVKNNSTTAGGGNEGIIFFEYIDGALVTGNVFPFSTAWPYRSWLGQQAPVWYRCSTDISVHDNDFNPRPAGMPESADHVCPT